MMNSNESFDATDFLYTPVYRTVLLQKKITKHESTHSNVAPSELCQPHITRYELPRVSRMLTNRMVRRIACKPRQALRLVTASLKRCLRVPWAYSNSIPVWMWIYICMGELATYYMVHESPNLKTISRLASGSCVSKPRHETSRTDWVEKLTSRLWTTYIAIAQNCWIGHVLA